MPRCEPLSIVTNAAGLRIEVPPGDPEDPVRMRRRDALFLAKWVRSIQKDNRDVQVRRSVGFAISVN